MIHFKNSADPAALSYAAVQSDRIYTVYELEQPEEPEYTTWDYIQDAVQVGLFLAAGFCLGTLMSILVVVGGR